MRYTNFYGARTLPPRHDTIRQFSRMNAMGRARIICQLHNLWPATPVISMDVPWGRGPL